MRSPARACIGIPVYNGEAYVGKALEAALSQTVRDIEVVVCDNASTDATEKICREYARDDARLRYVRYTEHVGLTESYSRTFAQCRSPYFKFAASDDVYAATFVERLLAALSAHPAAVGAYAETAVVDEQGATVRPDEFMIDLSDRRPARRFRQLVLAPPKHHGAHELYGVYRTEAMRRADPMPRHVYTDRILLARLVLAGPALRVPEILFHNRDHGKRSQRDAARFVRPGSTVSAVLGPGPWPPSEFYNPDLRGRIVFPEFDLLGQYAAAVRAADIPTAEKARCWNVLLAFGALRAPKFGRDTVIGAEQAGRLVARGRRPWRGGLHDLVPRDHAEPR